VSDLLGLAQRSAVATHRPKVESWSSGLAIYARPEVNEKNYYSSRFVSKSSRNSAITKLVIAKNDGIIWGLLCLNLRPRFPQFANQAPKRRSQIDVSL
jgi:hypothetical protein